MVFLVGRLGLDGDVGERPNHHFMFFAVRRSSAPQKPVIHSGTGVVFRRRDHNRDGLLSTFIFYAGRVIRIEFPLTNDPAAGAFAGPTRPFNQGVAPNKLMGGHPDEVAGVGGNSTDTLGVIRTKINGLNGVVEGRRVVLPPIWRTQYRPHCWPGFEMNCRSM